MRNKSGVGTRTSVVHVVITGLCYLCETGSSPSESQLSIRSTVKFEIMSYGWRVSGSIYAVF